MRQVGKLVGDDRGVDDCRSVNRQGVTDRFLQLVGLARREAMATAGARECGEIRIGKVNALLDTAARRSTRPPVGSSRTRRYCK